MGQSFHDSLTNMKMFVVLALAAMTMAEPEADPQLLYTAGVHTPVTSINNVPVVNAVPHVYTTGVHAPALVYTSAVPAVHSVVSSPLVSALTPAATLKTVHTPVTYTHAVAAPAVTYAGVHAVHTPVVNTVGSTVYYGKREAEADPALLYTNAVPAVHSVVGTHAVVGSPLVHHTYAVPTVAKTVVPAVTVAKAADHGVVGTYAGLVHSSHAGICLNNVGVQVPC